MTGGFLWFEILPALLLADAIERFVVATGWG